MESRAKLFGHAGHQLLIVFPLGLLSTSVIFSLIYLFNDNPVTATVAYWMQVAGIIGGLVAAPFGWIDWIAIPAGTRAKRIGLMHGLGNVLVLMLFMVSTLFWMNEVEAPPLLSLLLSFAGFVLAGITGWMGGELVDRLGVGVDDGAHLNAPNSLSHPSATSSSPR